MPGAIEHQSSKSWVFPDLEPVNPGEVVQPPPKRIVRPRYDRQPRTGTVQATTISFRNMSQYGDLLVRFMEARKRVFVDQLGWDVPNVDGMEFDQYDTPFARWIVIHDFGQVLGGFRLMPTTAYSGIYSYMLRDAQLGLLDQLPRDVLFLEAPVDERVWEASRLFITDDVPAAHRQEVHAVLMTQMAEASAQLGATHVIGIVPALFARWLRRLELAAVPVGRRFEIDGIRSQAALFKVTQNLH